MRKHRMYTIVASTVIATSLYSAPMAQAEDNDDSPSCTHSVNGMPIKKLDEMDQWSVDGIKFWTAPGEATELLKDFTQWFHDNIEPLDQPTKTKTGDDWSWAPAKPINGKDSPCSNHGSGTAVDLNAEKHPFKKFHTFTPLQEWKIRTKLLSYHGKIQWGGNWMDPRDEMHFEYVPDGKPLDNFKWIREYLPSGSSIGSD